MYLRTTFQTAVKSMTLIFTFAALTFFWSSCDDDGDGNPCANSDLDITVSNEGLTYTVAATGGESPYTYQVDEEGYISSTTFELETGGTHSFMVMDSKGCTVEQEVSVDACDGFAVEASASAYTISLSATYGTAPFNYDITNSAEETLKSGTFTDETSVDMDTAVAITITLTDANGCAASTTMTADEVRSYTDSRDDQTYLTIKIGDQIWFAENFNLNTNTSDSTSSWYYEDDSSTYAAEHGRLYTWYVAQSIAPEGWVLPTENNYNKLINSLGGENVAASKLIVGGISGFEATLSGLYATTDDSFKYYGVDFQSWASNESDIFDTHGVTFFVEKKDGENTYSVNIGVANKLWASSIRFLKK